MLGGYIFSKPTSANLLSRLLRNAQRLITSVVLILAFLPVPPIQAQTPEKPVDYVFSQSVTDTTPVFPMDGKETVNLRLSSNDSSILSLGTFTGNPGKFEVIVIESEFQRLNRLSEEALPEVLKQIRFCESSGNYQNNDTGRNGHYGAFQFDLKTWQSVGGSGKPNDAPKYEQDERALTLFNKRGTQPWACAPKSRPVAISYGEVTILYADKTNNCTVWAKQQTGINRSLGAGSRNAIQGHEPKVGAIGSLKGTPHSVVVTAINSDQISFKESNYKKNYITARTLPLSQFIGFVYV